MLIHRGLKSALALGYLTHNFCSCRKGKLLSQLQTDMQPDDLRSWQVLIFSQKERTVSTQEAIISIQEIVFFMPQAIYFLLMYPYLWQQLIFFPVKTKALRHKHLIVSGNWGWGGGEGYG